jgi:hypothetical protein
MEFKNIRRASEFCISLSTQFSRINIFHFQMKEIYSNLMQPMVRRLSCLHQGWTV